MLGKLVRGARGSGKMESSTPTNNERASSEMDRDRAVREGYGIRINGSLSKIKGK